MIDRTGTRRWIAVSGVIALACGGNVPAQTVPSAPRGGTARTTARAAASGSAAEAAAYQKLNAGQVDEAASVFQAILAAHSDDAGALAGMGQVRMLQGNYLGAVSFLEQAKQASPTDATIAAALDSARYSFLMGEGKNAQQTNHLDDAEKRYREALALRPDTQDPVTALADVLVLQNRLADAQQVLTAAVAHAAAATGRPPVELAVQLAEMDIANSQPQAAYPLFRQVLEEHPERLDAWSGLISALHLMGHDGDAVAQEKVIPDDTRAQLEATPGFQQMMTGMTSSPAAQGSGGVQNLAAGEPPYPAFVPSALTAAAPETVTPAAVAAPPASSVASLPPVAAPQRVTVPASVSTRPSATRPAVVLPAAKTAIAAPSQPAHVHVEAAQTATPTRPASSTGSGAPLVTQPAARPPSREEVPDTGDQQYPQPKARPRAPASASN